MYSTFFVGHLTPGQRLLKAGLQPVPAFALGSIFQLITERLGLLMIQHDDVPPSTLTAREVGQVLREVVLGRRITIYNDCDELDYCERCVSPEGRRWDFDPGDRTDPIALLSTWEHQTLERMLKAL